MALVGTGSEELPQKVLVRWAAREAGGWQQRHQAAEGGDTWRGREEEPACPDDPLNLNAGVIQLFGKEVHGLHGVFARVRVDVRPPGGYFNCRRAGEYKKSI